MASVPAVQKCKPIGWVVEVRFKVIFELLLEFSNRQLSLTASLLSKFEFVAYATSPESSFCFLITIDAAPSLQNIAASLSDESINALLCSAATIKDAVPSELDFNFSAVRIKAFMKPVQLL